MFLILINTCRKCWKIAFLSTLKSNLKLPSSYLARKNWCPVKTSHLHLHFWRLRLYKTSKTISEHTYLNILISEKKSFYLNLHIGIWPESKKQNKTKITKMGVRTTGCASSSAHNKLHGFGWNTWLLWVAISSTIKWKLWIDY